MKNLKKIQDYNLNEAKKSSKNKKNKKICSFPI
jgi:hypothetical protein